jgi:hypothetical protein
MSWSWCVLHGRQRQQTNTVLSRIIGLPLLDHLGHLAPFGVPSYKDLLLENIFYRLVEIWHQTFLRLVFMDDLDDSARHNIYRIPLR